MESAELIAWAATRFGAVELLADLSWPHGEARVLSLATEQARVIVKAFRNRVHFERECEGCRFATPSLAPALLALDEQRLVIALGYLPGTLAQVARDRDPEVHFRAAQLLRRLHDRDEGTDYELGRRIRASFERYAERGLVADEDIARVRSSIERIEDAPITVVGCHGDFSPRNWLVDDGEVRLIDFARFQRDHWTMDLLVLSRRYWTTAPDLREAFFAGYGRTIAPGDEAYVRAAMGRWAVGTIVWAREHDDAPFEQLGRDTLAQLYSPIIA